VWYNIPMDKKSKMSHISPIDLDEYSVTYATENPECVEEALLARAMGFQYNEIKYERVPIFDYVPDDRGNLVQTIVDYEYKKVGNIIRYSPPDVSAIKLWLSHTEKSKSRWGDIDVSTENIMDTMQQIKTLLEKPVKTRSDKGNETASDECSEELGTIQ